MLIDTHCHLDFDAFHSDRDAAIQRAFDNKIGAMINVGSSIEATRASQLLAERFAPIYFTIGFHPHHADSFDASTLQAFAGLHTHAKLVAIGEIGLDYFRSRATKPAQEKAFRAFIALGRELNLPLVVHTRESFPDTLRILKEERGNFSGVVFHCFSGSVDILQHCLDEGAMVSFTATITYPQAQELQAVVKKTPLERMMLETDAPFLPPQQYRGKRNEPSYVHQVAAAVAELKKINVDEVARATTNNAIKFFRLNPTTHAQHA